MKGISLWEPWASAIAWDLKRIETRGWLTPYRGPLAICAARTTLHAGFIHDPSVRRYFESVGITRVDRLPFGHIVAVARLNQIYPVEHLTNISEQERAFGNYDAGRFGWDLADLRRLKTPIPFRGMQGLFRIPFGTLDGALFE